mgnify:CR=1 FL=1
MAERTMPPRPALRRAELALFWGGLALTVLGAVMTAVPAARFAPPAVVLGVGLAALGLNVLLGGDFTAGPRARTYTARGQVVRGRVEIAAGLVVSIFGWTLPSVVDNFTRLLGGAAGPGALFAIGAALGGQRLRIDREIGALIAAKLVLYPVAVALSLYLVFRPDPFVAAIGVLCAAMPGASNSFIIAERYGVPTAAISAAIAAGTAFSVLTISLTIWLLGLR